MSAKVKLHISDANGTKVHLDGVVSSEVAVDLEKALLVGVKSYLLARGKATLDGTPGKVEA
jgi:hypothetical protein